MVMRMQSIVAVVGVNFVVWLAPATALAQFPAPPNALALEDSGTLEDIRGPLVLIRDSQNETWLVRIHPDTKITVTGEADEELLRPGTFVQLTGEIDDKGKLLKPVTELEIVSPLGKDELGLYRVPAEGEEVDNDAKPLRKPEAGTFRICGKLALFKGGKLVVVAGRRIEGKVDEKLKVNVSLEDLSVAQYGDEVNLKAWYYNAYKPQPVRNVHGQALAEEITIKLANPLTADNSKRKSRRAEGDSKSDDSKPDDESTQN